MASNVLTREVAGQPVGVWLVVVAGGLGLAYFFNRNQTSDGAQREPLVEPGVGTGLIPAGAGFQQSGDGDNGDDGFSNNLEWGTAVKNWLLGQGHDGTTVDRAVNRYLAGEQLTVQENALVTQAIANLGAPPEATAPSPEPSESNDPTLNVDLPYTVTAPYNGSFRVNGNVSIGGSAPARPQLVEFIGYSQNGIIPFRRGVHQTDPDGNFSFNVATWGGRNDRRRFVVRWKGEQTSHRLQNT